MIISKNIRLELVFELKNAPFNHENKWLKFKKKCESGKNENIVKSWLSYCNIPTVKNIPYLNRLEGGLGEKNKQIRFRFSHNDSDDNIVLNIKNYEENEQWLYDELNDLIKGFENYANNYLETESVIGYIKIKPTY